MDKFKSWYGFLIIIIGSVVPLIIFTVGVLLVGDTWAANLFRIDNRTFIWVIAVPFLFLISGYIIQLFLYRLDTNKEIQEKVKLYESQHREIKELNEKRLDEVKHLSDLFSIINAVSNKDIYSSTMFSFLMEKIHRDIEQIKNKNFFTEEWYWELSNKFILHEDKSLCTCALTPDQVKESDIEEYFKEQFKFIQTGQIKIERVLIVKTTSALKEFTSFVAKQLNGGVDFYVLSKDFADCRSINNADWNSGFNRDFALIGSEEKARYIIERKILENEIKGYEIKEIVGYSPFYVENIVNKRKPVRNFIQYFGDGQYNPIEDFFKKDTIN